MQDFEDTRGTVERHRAEQLAKLVELAADGRKPQDAERYRAAATQLVSDIKTADKLLSVLSAPLSRGKYKPYKRAIEAIDAFFEQTGEPATEAEIVDAIVEGGFRSGSDEDRANISRSLSIYVSGAPNKSGRIKRIGKRFGPFDWPDELFKD